VSTYPAYRICRLCKDRGGISSGLSRYTPETRLVKYGTRHYAHHQCYLDSGKPLTDLHVWQLESFPWRLIVDRGPEFVAAFEQLLTTKQAEVEADRARYRAMLADAQQQREAKQQRDQLTLDVPSTVREG
jgi:hypothetical protein